MFCLRILYNVVMGVIENQNKLTLELAYLYPKLLNIYGDRGNVLTLLFRCRQRGIELNITSIGINNEELDSTKFDIYFIGGGQDQQQILVAEDIQIKKKQFVNAIDSGAVVLAVCGGYQLLGKYYKTSSGFEVKGIEAIDLFTVAGNKRMIGNVICKEIESGKTLVGFENHSGKTYLGKGVSPLAKIIRGGGNNGEDGFEGVRYKNVFGTYLHGSLLPKNPFLADKIIRLALERKGYKFPDVSIDDSVEELAHEKAKKLNY